MRLIIAGSRHLKFGLMLISDGVKEAGFEPTTILSGASFGADTYGEMWAEERNIPVVQYPADWNKHGKAAGPIRNAQMAENADALLLIWDGKSRGSASMLHEAQKRGLKIHQVII